jgi:D-beta-D-heptose 7-phosphate kinase/D-beta-D-heptose 1-phosphate adenosyltransferase
MGSAADAASSVRRGSGGRAGLLRVLLLFERRGGASCYDRACGSALREDLDLAHDLIARLEKLGNPRVMVVGDLVLDRYIWGFAERISQEAPVPLLRADQREHRLGGAASVATMLRCLGAEVRLMGGVGRDAEADLVRRMLAEQGIDDGLVLPLDDRPTTLKERYIGRAQDRHPQQMIRVDYETRDPIPALVESRLHAELPAVLEWAQVVLVSDYGKGVCTPTLLHAVFDAARAAGVRVLADPIRSSDYACYRGVHCMTPNRLEAQLATGMTISRVEDALRVGKQLVEMLRMEAVLVTLDRDGMALVRADGRAELLPTRPRQVYDITGAGDMVLAVVGLCLASGADYDEAAALGNVAGGLEVEKFGVALLTREEILRDLADHHRSEGSKILDRGRLLAEVHRRRLAGQTIGFTNGCFDILHPGHVRLLREAASQGDFLVVGLNSDASVRRLKGSTRPINPVEARAEVVSALEAVDAVTVFDEDTPLALITAIRPDVLVKGNDYRPEEVIGRAEVEEAGGRLVLIPIVEGHSTTSMVLRSSERERSPLGGAAVPAPHLTRVGSAIPSLKAHDRQG